MTNNVISTQYEAEYEGESNPIKDTERDHLTVMEAQEALKEIQYAAITGTDVSVRDDTKRRLHYWIMFNPALFKMMETTMTFTSNVNYKP